ncbi:hypothetical protein GOC91_27045 [Sinorhizobium medicae]|uniref:Uncharacterized protein n=2 Tax=Sinorhizobium medicae TaxID=110321 RepID=A0A508WPE0_9HYPH|nr:hypothetical protein [Sinorhizobium medicae]ABR64555.1 hypothetical protein Smed_5861 [Sinorhizobium medicae WSM419]MBO1944875.1 hypothetical protein [Sinorhizobium medicae]MBO1960528.1 hypothetical protein [Sinorhizobium medicae]MDX0408051.1 hypothetical protein [Sinorhizobium medicae]MDX0413696.1 hypothetical protein [Sinorhizobium medicae]
MTFRAINRKYFEPGSQLLMIFGIIALCQPWNLFLHRYGLTMTLVGLIAFMITSKVPPDQKTDESTSP